MNIVNIQNREIVNLENCEDEPISIPGSIQPHGFILILDQQYAVVFCSANLHEYGLEVSKTLNRHITEILNAEEATALTGYLDSRNFESASPHKSRVGEMEYNTSVHISGMYFMLEFEPFPDGSLKIANLYLQTQKFAKTLSKATGLRSLCQSVSEEVRYLTGYDRVMIYRFDAQYNGEVFAEAKDEALEPFLGLHYPHTDIPPQARELYMKNMMRMIADVHYTPVPIVTYKAGASNADVDLGQSMLRSVSPIHIEYLKNMGVSATLTISLIFEGRLWGLIACHHYSAKNIPYYVRISALLQGHFLTSQIKVQEVTAEYELKLEMDKRVKDFLDELDTYSAREEVNIATKELCDVANANGVCIASDDELHCYGDVPHSDEVKKLVNEIEIKKGEVYHSNSLAADLGITLINGIAGALFYKLNAGHYIIWFRNELSKEINWAGEPAKAIVKDVNGLSPRKSFSLWKERVTGYSSEWLAAELNATAQAVYAVQKHFSQIRDKKIQKTQENLLAQLKQANDELENINWISTHDLREPLRKIRVFISILLDAEKYELNDEVMQMMKRITLAVTGMQKLLDDLLSFSRIKNNNYKFKPEDLNALMDKVLQNNEEIIAEKGITVHNANLPTINCLSVLIGQLFANLISNSIKFARPSVPLVITISCRDVYDDAGHKQTEITIADNGKGFENEYKDIIFQVFQRLEKKIEIEGTGIGLAICKKIVAMHKGHITAQGRPGEGSQFIITLPYQP